MKDNLREALLGVRSHLMKIKAGKYNEESEEKDEPIVAAKKDTDSDSDRGSRKPEVSEEDNEESDLDEMEKVEFFRKKKRKPKIGHERIVGFGG